MAIFNYKNFNMPFRFRILELTLCSAIIILTVLCLILKSRLELYIVFLLLIFSVAFALICLFSLMEHPDFNYKRWLCFTTVGMAAYFLISGFICISITFWFNPPLILLAILATTLVTGIVFLVDIFLVLRRPKRPFIKFSISEEDCIPCDTQGNYKSINKINKFGVPNLTDTTQHRDSIQNISVLCTKRETSCRATNCPIWTEDFKNQEVNLKKENKDVKRRSSSYLVTSKPLTKSAARHRSSTRLDRPRMSSKSIDKMKSPQRSSRHNLEHVRSSRSIDRTNVSRTSSKYNIGPRKSQTRSLSASSDKSTHRHSSILFAENKVSRKSNLTSQSFDKTEYTNTKQNDLEYRRPATADTVCPGATCRSHDKSSPGRKCIKNLRIAQYSTRSRDYTKLTKNAFLCPEKLYLDELSSKSTETSDEPKSSPDYEKTITKKKETKKKETKKKKETEKKYESDKPIPTRCKEQSCPANQPYCESICRKFQGTQTDSSSASPNTGNSMEKHSRKLSRLTNKIAPAPSAPAQLIPSPRSGSPCLKINEATQMSYCDTKICLAGRIIMGADSFEDKSYPLETKKNKMQIPSKTNYKIYNALGVPVNLSETDKNYNQNIQKNNQDSDLNIQYNNSDSNQNDPFGNLDENSQYNNNLDSYENILKNNETVQKPKEPISKSPRNREVPRNYNRMNEEENKPSEEMISAYVFERDTTPLPGMADYMTQTDQKILSRNSSPKEDKIIQVSSPRNKTPDNKFTQTAFRTERSENVSNQTPRYTVDDAVQTTFKNQQIQNQSENKTSAKNPVIILVKDPYACSSQNTRCCCCRGPNPQCLRKPPLSTIYQNSYCIPTIPQASVCPFCLQYHYVSCGSPTRDRSPKRNGLDEEDNQPVTQTQEISINQSEDLTTNETESSGYTEFSNPAEVPKRSSKTSDKTSNTINTNPPEVPKRSSKSSDKSSNTMNNNPPEVPKRSSKSSDKSSNTMNNPPEVPKRSSKSSDKSSNTINNNSPEVPKRSSKSSDKSSNTMKNLSDSFDQ